MTCFAYAASAVCIVGALALWFSHTYRQLAEKRRGLDGLLEQLRLHLNAAAQVRDGPEKAVAERMLSVNRSILRQAADDYNRLLQRPENRLPARLMGFRPVDGARLQQSAERRGTPSFSPQGGRTIRL